MLRSTQLDNKENPLEELAIKLANMEKTILDLYKKMEENEENRSSFNFSKKKPPSNYKKILESFTENYKIQLVNTAAILQDISSQIFISVQIHHVKYYNKTEIVPKDYQQYLNAVDNFAHFVKMDFFSQEELKNSNKKNSANIFLIRLERWVHIAKLSYENNDFFSAHSLLCGITSVLNLIPKIETKLSPYAQAMLEYLQSFFSNPKALFSFQNAAYKKNQLVIPVFSSLCAMLIPIKENEMKMSIREPYYRIQTLLMNSSSILMHDNYKILLEPPIAFEEEMHAAQVSMLKSELKKADLNVDLLFTPFYTPHDKYYVHLWNLKNLYKEFGLMVHHEKDVKIGSILNKFNLNTILASISNKDKLGALEKFSQTYSNLLSKSNKKFILLLKDIRIELSNIASFEEIPENTLHSSVTSTESIQKAEVSHMETASTPLEIDNFDLSIISNATPPSPVLSLTPPYRNKEKSHSFRLSIEGPFSSHTVTAGQSPSDSDAENNAAENNGDSPFQQRPHTHKLSPSLGKESKKYSPTTSFLKTASKKKLPYTHSDPKIRQPYVRQPGHLQHLESLTPRLTTPRRQSPIVTKVSTLLRDPSPSTNVEPEPVTPTFLISTRGKSTSVGNFRTAYKEDILPQTPHSAAYSQRVQKKSDPYKNNPGKVSTDGMFGRSRSHQDKPLRQEHDVQNKGRLSNK